MISQPLVGRGRGNRRIYQFRRRGKDIKSAPKGGAPPHGDPSILALRIFPSRYILPIYLVLYAIHQSIYVGLYLTSVYGTVQLPEF